MNDKRTFALQAKEAEMIVDILQDYIMNYIKEPLTADDLKTLAYITSAMFKIRPQDINKLRKDKNWKHYEPYIISTIKKLKLVD